MAATAALKFDLFANDRTGPGIRSADSNFSKFGKGLVTKFAAAGAAIGGISLLGDFISEAQESARVGKLTENVIRSTGGAAKVSADQVGALATAISNKVGVDDEAIQSGANLLLTFTGIRNEVGKGNDIFNQATKAAVDMAAGLNNGQVTADNLKGTSIQLGKALNDPLKGITALTRSGVSFTEAQKNQIKEMVKSGDTMGAQKLILGELTREFGGAAAAAASPADKAKVAWGNLQEQIGMKLLPLFNKVATFASNTLIPAISTGVEKLGPVFSSISKAVSVFFNALAGKSEMNEFSGKLQTINNVGIKVGAWIRDDFLPAAKQFGNWLMTTGIPAVQKLGQWLATNLWPAIKQVAASFQQNLLPALQGLTKKFQEAWPTIQRFLTIVGAIASFILTKVVPVLIRFYSNYLATLIKVFGEVFSAGWKVIGFLIDIGAAIGRAGAAFGRFVGKVAGAMTDAYNAVKKGVGDAVEFVKGMPGKIVSGIGNLGKTLWNVGTDLIQGFINGIKNKAGEILTTIKDSITDKIPGWIKKPLGIGSPSKLTKQYGMWVAEGFAIGIKDGEDKVADAVGRMVDKLKAKIDAARDFAKQLRDQFRSFGNVTSIDTLVSDAAGNQTEGGLAELLKQERAKVAQAKQFAATMTKLRKMGLNADTLGALRDAGPDQGLKAASQILGGGSGAIAEFNSLAASLNQIGKQFAGAETRAQFGINPYAKSTAMITGNGQTVKLVLDPSKSSDKLTRALIESLREWVRVNGQGNVQVALGAKK